MDEEALRDSPFIQQVTELAEQLQAERDSTESPAQNEGEGSSEYAAQEHPYKVGDTVYLDDRPFVITQIGHFNIQLQDPSQAYPIFRSESIERFEQLLMLDERNTGLLSSDSVKEGHTFTTETEAVYPGEKNGLPYDVVIERLRVEEPAHHQPKEKDMSAGQKDTIPMSWHLRCSISSTTTSVPTLSLSTRFNLR